MLALTTYLTTLGTLEVIGVLGFIVYIVAFGSVQLGMLDGNSTAYCLLNILAASLVAMSLLAEFNLASALIQCSWIAIGLVGLMLRGTSMRRARSTDFHNTEQLGEKS